MTDNLFKDSTCPIQEVPQVDFDFVTVDVCTPIPAPPPIFGCMTPIVPREPDTEVGLTCPTFTPIVNLNAGYCAPSPPGGTAVVVKTGTDPCAYEFELNLNIPAVQPPCPIIGDTALAVTSGFADCLVDIENSFTANVTTLPGDCDTPDQCLMDFALNLTVPIPRTPCPNINLVDFNVVTGFSDSECMANPDNHFTITPTVTPGDCNNPDQCDFDLDVAIAIPIPRTPCPTLRVDNFQVATGFADCITNIGNHLTITPVPTAGDCDNPDQCDFKFDFALTVPIPRTYCPTIRRGDFSVTSGYAGFCSVENKFEINPTVTPGNCNSQDSCDFSIDLDLFVPIPPPVCPAIYVKQFNVTTGYDTCVSGDNTFDITPTETDPTCDAPGTCDYAVSLDLYVPIPKPNCPTLTPGNVNVYTGYIDCSDVTENVSQLTITPTIGESDCGTPTCDFTIDLDVVVPIPKVDCPQIFASSAFSGNATGYFNVTPATNEANCDSGSADGPTCDYLFDLSVYVPIPDCPIIRQKDGVVRSGYYEENSVTLTVLPTKDNKNVCLFDITPTISVNIPIPPCTVWAGGLTVLPGAIGSTPSGFIVDASAYSPGEACVIAPQIVLTIPTQCIPQLIPKPGIVYLVSPSVGPAAEIVIENIPNTCTYTLQPYIKMLRPWTECAVFDTSKSSIYLNGDKTKTVNYTFDIEQTSQDPDTGRCYYAATLWMDLPICEYELKPDLSEDPDVKWGEYEDPNKVKPTLTFQIQPETEEINNCTYYLKPSLRIPKGWPYTGMVYVDKEETRGKQEPTGELGYGTFEINEKNEVKINIFLYTAECPTTSGGGTGGGSYAFTEKPTTIDTPPPVSAPLGALPFAAPSDYTELQNAILNGIKKSDTGAPINPVFYSAIREMMQDILNKN